MQGAFFAGLAATAAEGIDIESSAAPEGLDVEQWYPWPDFSDLLERIGRFPDSDRLLERIGMKMMERWYSEGPGADMLASGLDYLDLQRRSRGYRMVVRGPLEQTGHCRLEEFDGAGGFARVGSRTLFPRPFERGVLLSGLGLVGDLLYFDVREHPSSGSFHIFFVTDDNRRTLGWHRGEELAASQWRLLHQGRRAREQELFWKSVGRAILQSQSSPAPTPIAGAAVTDLWALRLPELSSQEIRVVSGVLAGHTLRQIAGEIGVAYTTVLTYQQRAFVKLGVGTQKELLRLLLV